jgi:hypothetical protein
MTDEYELKDRVLALIQEDDQITLAVTEAIKLKRNDWLTNLVQTIAATMRIVNQAAKIIKGVVDWLNILF